MVRHSGVESFFAESEALAIYHASTKSLSRSDGRSAVASVAYRVGERLEDARTGLVHDYSRRSGVMVAEILTPDGGGADRSALWNAAEAAEKRKDSRTAREWVLALPAELEASERHELARAFAAQLVERYGVAADLAIHAPSREGDDRNHHAHIFLTTRRIERDGSGALAMGDKAAMELSDSKRRGLGLKAVAEEVKELRRIWEDLANAALERAGRAERIDQRSLEAQGIDREPTQHMGPEATQMERRGEGSERGEVNRQVSARNEARAAEIVNLELERQRRAQEERARLAREAEAARAAEAARKAAEALQERERRQREAEARKAQEEAQRAAEAETERKTARLLAMTAQELACEIARLRPDSPEKLALQSPETAKAQERVRLLVEERQAVEARRQQAEAGISAYRKRYRLRASLHDMGLMKSRDLTKHAKTIAEVQREEARLEPLASVALGEFAMLRDQASARIAKEQEPLLKLVAGMEKLQARKAREETRARREAEERRAVERSAQAAKEAQAAAREAQARKDAEERLAAERAAQAAKEREEAQKRAEQEEREFWKLAKANPEAAQIEAIKKAHLEGAEGDTARRRLRELKASEREQEAPAPKTSPKTPASDREEALRAERERQENAERQRQFNEKRARDRARGRDRDR